MRAPPDPLTLVADRLDPPRDPFASDPEGFITERLKAYLWSVQRAIIRSVWANPKTAVPACYSSSKTFTAAQIAAAWLQIHPIGTAKVVTTSTTFNQVKTQMWPEIRGVHKRGGLRGRVNQTEWLMRDLDGVEQVYGMGLSTRDATAFQGHHAEYVLVIIDEADGVAQEIWDAAEGLATTPEDRILAIGNPWDPTGPFARACKPGSGWKTIRIAAADTPMFTGEHVPARLARLLISPQWVDDKVKTWGQKDPRYISKVLARFPQDVAGTLIHLAWLEAAQARSLDKSTPIELGVDIAEGVERDETVIVLRWGPWARVHHASRTTSIPEATGLVARAIRELGASVAKIDAVGIGAAVYQELRAQGLPVVGLKAGERPRDSDGYYNLGAEMYGGLRDRARDEDLDLDPDDDESAGQLISVKATYNSRGQLVLETKDQRRRRKLSSPDRADAYALAFYPVAVSDYRTSDQDSSRSGSITGDLLDEARTGA